MLNARSSSAKPLCFGFVVGLAFVSSTAFAEEPPPPPPEAQAVVADQLEAFARDDATVAWQLAAPEIREKFATASDFIGMVKTKYGPVYRHRSVDFGHAARKGDEIGMEATIVSEDNEVWSVVFLLSKQSDGAWRTSGCMLQKAPQTSV